MDEFVKVAETSEIPAGRIKLVDVRGERVAVANVGGTFCAFSDECTHDGGPLSEGELEGEIVRCPWHFSSFNVRTGEVVDSPAEDYITVYDVQVEGDAVLIGRPKAGDLPPH